MKKYLAVFAATYAAATIAVGVITTMLEINGSSLGIGVLIAAAIAAAGSFVKDQQRVPTKQERHRLAWGSFAASLLISALIAAVVLPLTLSSGELATIMAALGALPAWIWIAIALITSAIYLAVLYLSYGWYPKLALRQLERARSR